MESRKPASHLSQMWLMLCYGPLRDECRFHGVDGFVYLRDMELVSRSLVNLIRDWSAGKQWGCSNFTA